MEKRVQHFFAQNNKFSINKGILVVLDGHLLVTQKILVVAIGDFSGIILKLC